MLQGILLEMLLIASDPQNSAIREIPKAFTCPRCRRKEPKGPMKRPDPRYMPKPKPNPGVKNP